MIPGDADEAWAELLMNRQQRRALARKHPTKETNAVIAGHVKADLIEAQMLHAKTRERFAQREKKLRELLIEALEMGVITADDLDGYFHLSISP